MTSRDRFIAANWKMNASCQSLELWLRAMDGFESEYDLALCPPFPYLVEAKSIVNKLHNTKLTIGAQDCSAYAEGAYTGEVSAAMLKEIGCDCVIVGHSERRQYHHETDELVATKMVAVMQAEMIAIACIGESLKERQAHQTRSVLAKQFKPLLEAISTQKLNSSHLVIAYEPIWAIGTGLNAESEQIAEVAFWIRQQATEALGQTLANQLRILYGGSMKPSNARTIFSIESIDGGLIGGASLLSASFQAIVSSA